MKKISLFIILVFIPVLAFAQQNHYTIKGTGESLLDGDTIYLCQIRGLFSIQRIDSTIVKNGQYTFTGSHPGCDVRYILTQRNGKYSNIISLMLENADITVRSFDPKTKKEPEVTGGDNFKLWKRHKEIDNKWKEKRTPYAKIMIDSVSTLQAKQKAQRAIDSLDHLQMAEEMQFVVANMPAPYCDLVLASNFKKYSTEQQNFILAAFKEKMPEATNYKRILAETKANEATAVGKRFTDFSMQTPNGGLISVGAVIRKNRYTLVDFWASWCGPCRAEMPHVVEAYNRFHEKGFEVIGVSLDNNHDAWVKAIENLKMPWPHISDLKGWQSEGAAIYNVKAIPANVLVDGNGTIVARDLRGIKLINKMEELLK